MRTMIALAERLDGHGSDLGVLLAGPEGVQEGVRDDGRVDLVVNITSAPVGEVAVDRDLKPLELGRLRGQA